MPDKPWDKIERRSPERETENKQHIIAVAASEAAKVVSDAAAVALQTIAQAASTAQTSTNKDIEYIKNSLLEIKVILKNDYVTKDQFNPVSRIAYGLVAIMCLSVVGAIMALVIKR